MPVLMDTSVLAAFLNPRDENHARAKGLMREVMLGGHGTPISSDAVLAEGLTLLRRRPGRRDVSTRFAGIFAADGVLAPIVRLRRATAEELDRAVAFHFSHYDRQLSITDCLLLGLAADMSAPIASFDEGFDGLVERLR